MSTTTIEQFMDRIEGDPTFAARVDEALGARDDKRQALIDFASAEGFALPSLGRDALGDDELEQVAGGFNPQPEPPPQLGFQRFANYFAARGIIIVNS
jgi:hypothetical protein